MGIGIVLLFWGIVGLVGAAIGSGVLYGIAWDLTRGKIQGSRALSWAVRMFPFACIVWMGMVWNVYAVVNETVFHRDPGIGDAWKCPLPNGYAILMIDVTDQGVVYNPRTQTYSDTVASQSDTARACVLQVAGTILLGGDGCQNLRLNAPDAVSSYFLLDTTTGKRVDIPRYEGLLTAAAAKGIQVHLESIEEVYYRYRFTWFDYVVGVAMFGLPLVGGILLLRSLWRVRKGHPVLAGKQWESV